MTTPHSEEGIEALRLAASATSKIYETLDEFLRSTEAGWLALENFVELNNLHNDVRLIANDMNYRWHKAKGTPGW